jgi:hypothetical protein
MVRIIRRISRSNYTSSVVSTSFHEKSQESGWDVYPTELNEAKATEFKELNPNSNVLSPRQASG